jgi:hypothetical protein
MIPARAGKQSEYESSSKGLDGTGTELGCTRPNSLLVVFALERRERVSPRPQLQPK